MAISDLITRVLDAAGKPIAALAESELVANKAAVIAAAKALDRYDHLAP
jgi:hypothetical protein